METKVNLLQTLQSKNINLGTTNKEPTEKTAPSQIAQTENKNLKLSPQPQKDMFVKKNIAEKYSGVAALALTTIGIPTSYILSKRKDTKQLNELKKAVENISNQLANTNIEEKVAKAVQNASHTITPNPVSLKSALTTALIGIGSVAGVKEFVKNNRNNLKDKGYTKDDIKDAKSDAVKILQSSQKAIDGLNMANEAKAVAYESRNISNDARNIASSFDSRINVVNEKVDNAVKAAEIGLSPLMEAYTVRHYDLNLLQVLNNDKKVDKTRESEAYDFIHNAAVKRLDRSSEDTIADIKKFRETHDVLNSVWSLTAEYKPIKMGGLGDVPLDMQNNFIQLGIDSPTFIPMYLKKNKSEFVEDNGKYSYIYNNDKFDLKKLAETTTNVYRNGLTIPQKIEFFSSKIPVTKNGRTFEKTLVFVKNNDYFTENIYDSTTSAEETEKFALFPKVVYELAKYKIADAYLQKDIEEAKAAGKPFKEYTLKGVSNFNIIDKDAFNEIKAPAAFILNDWHAASMAGLLRYRAPLEYAYHEISDRTADALKNMTTLLIGHNLGCQGKSNDGSGSLLSKNRVTENIINTLYDSYAIAVAENAHSGIVFDNDPNNDDLCNTVLLKRKTADKHYNHIFNGVALSDWFVPVSKTYTKEIINDPQKSGILYPLLQRRQNSGTISGTVNGFDKVIVNMEAVKTNNRVPGLTLETYDENTPIEDIVKRRAINKGNFYEKFIKPAAAGKFGGLELIGGEHDPFTLTKEEFLNTPLISFAHRLTEQKGLKLFAGAIFRLFDNWEENFPGKPLPVVLVGGPPEDAGQLKYLYDLKNPDYGENKERVSHVIALKGGMPNPAITSVSDLFTAPSTYEPCGLLQAECDAKGTPILATDTGGYHDTIEDGVTGFLTSEISEESLYKKLVKILDLYYNNHVEYNKIIQNELKLDFSWAQQNKSGPIFEYTEKLGYDKKEFTDYASGE